MLVPYIGIRKVMGDFYRPTHSQRVYKSARLTLPELANGSIQNFDRHRCFVGAHDQIAHVQKVLTPERLNHRRVLIYHKLDRLFGIGLRQRARYQPQGACERQRSPQHGAAGTKFGENRTAKSHDEYLRNDERVNSVKEHNKGNL